MATAVATKPALMQQKMKRPPPPSVQTGVNGVKSSQSSPSPSLSSKPAPPGAKHPSSSSVMDAPNGGANGSGPRISNRRRESQKPGDIQGRPYTIRGNKVASGPGSSLDRRSAKRLPEPYGTWKFNWAVVCYGDLEMRDILTALRYSEDYLLRSAKVPKSSSLPYLTPPPYTFPLRSPRRQLFVQFACESHSRTY